MEYMPDFKVLHPSTIDDALRAHSDADDARYLAGGTDVLVNMRRGIVEPSAMVNLANIAEMRAVTELEDGGIKIGAGVTLADLATDQRIVDGYSVIAEAALNVAATSHREVATLGGNLCLDTRCVFYNQSEWWRGANAYCLKYKGDICHVAPSGKICFAAYSGDVAPAILVCQGLVEIAGPDGRRTVPLSDIYRDDGLAHLRLNQGEILCAILLPAPTDGMSGYAKVRVRSAIDFPLVGVAITLGKRHGILSDLKVALTGTNACPFMLAGTEHLIGKTFDDQALEQLVTLIPKQIQPMSSTFTTPGYRRKVVSNLTRSLARRLFANA